jgi:hypothetical protein
VITAAGKCRLGIPGVSVVFFIDDAIAQRVTNAVQERSALLSLSVEDFWAGAPLGFIPGTLAWGEVKLQVPPRHAGTGRLRQEDPGSQKRDLGHPSVSDSTHLDS